MKYDQEANCRYCGKKIVRAAASGASWKAPEVNEWHQTLCHAGGNTTSYHYPAED